MRIKVSKEIISDSQVKLWGEACVAHFCAHCGSEIVGRWIYPNDEKRQKHAKAIEAMRAEAKTVIALQTCPCCSNTLPRSKGYLAVHDYNNAVIGKLDQKHLMESFDLYDLTRINYEDPLENLYPAMRRLRDKAYAIDAEKEVFSLIACFEQGGVVRKSDGASKCNTPDAIIAYLATLIKVEENIYSLAAFLKQQLAKQHDVNRNAIHSEMSLLANAKRLVQLAEDKCEKLRKESEEIRLTKPAPLALPKLVKPHKPEPPTLETPGFFNKKKIMAQNAELTQRYEQQCAAYQTALANYNKQLAERQKQMERHAQEQEDKRKQALDAVLKNIGDAEAQLAQERKKLAAVIIQSDKAASPEKAEKYLLDQQISKTKSLLLEAIQCRQKLYSYGVLAEKYCNLIAVTTIYEYFTTGRCVSLEGANGAYNLFESETRANIIISHLGVLMESLETVKANQRMIYDSIQKTNTMLAKLERTMETATKTLGKIQANSEDMAQYLGRIAQNSDMIAHNTAVNAYYSQINAELTDALGYMIALR